MKLINALMGCLLVGVLAVGCATQASVRVSNELTSPFLTDADHQKADDEALQERIQRLLKVQLAKNSKTINVLVDNSNVLLSGQVASLSLKNQAESLCANLHAVNKVFNYLTVNAKPVLNTNSSISSDAKTRLDSQNNIDGQAIKIVTVDNIVYLMGTNIGDLSALNLAINGIYSIDGVKSVTNLIQKGAYDYYGEPPVQNDD